MRSIPNSKTKKKTVGMVKEEDGFLDTVGLSQSHVYFKIWFYDLLSEYTILKNANLAPTYFKTNFKPRPAAKTLTSLKNIVYLFWIRIWSSVLLSRFFEFLIYQTFEARVCLYSEVKIELLWKLNALKPRKSVAEPFFKYTKQVTRIIQIY